jgi:hypothetical protein
MNHNLERLPPTQMRETLGVLLSSNGSANTQLTLYIEKYLSLLENPTTVTSQTAYHGKQSK